MPHRICRDLNLGRSFSCADAINKAPVVDYGDTSTIDAHTPIPTGCCLCRSYQV